MSALPTSLGKAQSLAVMSLAFGGLAALSGVAEASVIVTSVNTDFSKTPVTIAFNGLPQFKLSRVADPNFGLKNYIQTLGANLYAQQVLAGRIVSDQPDPVPGNVSLKFVAAPTATDLLSVPHDVEFFVPLEVVSGTTRNFGYAELGTSNGGATLVSYAFETIPGQSLTTAQFAGSLAGTTAVPEPASLAMLALGAAGVLAARRRAGAQSA